MPSIYTPQAFERLLASEEARIAGDQFHSKLNSGSAQVAFGPPRAPLGDFILAEIERGPKTKDELREAAEAVGYFKDTAGSPGRVVHATILHLLRDMKIVIQTGGRIMSMRQVKARESRALQVVEGPES